MVANFFFGGGGVANSWGFWDYEINETGSLKFKFLHKAFAAGFTVKLLLYHMLHPDAGVYKVPYPPPLGWGSLMGKNIKL